MKLSTALRRAAECSLDGGNQWYYNLRHPHYMDARVLAANAHMPLPSDIRMHKPDRICTCLLLLAEIAEGEGR